MTWTVLLFLLGVQTPVEITVDEPLCRQVESRFKAGEPASVRMDDGSLVTVVDVVCVAPDPCDCEAKQEVAS
jgi:hypothetical protein